MQNLKGIAGLPYQNKFSNFKDLDHIKKKQFTIFR